MNAILEWAKHNAKSIIAFLAGLIVNAVQAVITGQVPWPKSLAEWGQYLGTSLLAGVMVWATGNKLYQKQIINGAVQQGITVITNTAIDTAANAAEAAVHDATSHLPGVVSKPVDDVAQQVSSTVTGVLKGIAANFPGVNLTDIA